MPPTLPAVRSWSGRTLTARAGGPPELHAFIHSLTPPCIHAALQQHRCVPQVRRLGSWQEVGSAVRPALPSPRAPSATAALPCGLVPATTPATTAVALCSPPPSVFTCSLACRGGPHVDHKRVIDLSPHRLDSITRCVCTPSLIRRRGGSHQSGPFAVPTPHCEELLSC